MGLSSDGYVAGTAFDNENIIGQQWAHCRHRIQTQSRAIPPFSPFIAVRPAPTFP